MWGSKNYRSKILFTLAGAIVLVGCKQEVQPAAAPPAVKVSIDSTIVAASPKLVISNGLHERINQRLSPELSNDSSYLDFEDWLRYEQGPFTFMMPGFDNNQLKGDTDQLNWKDYLLAQELGSPYIAAELNGLRTFFSLKSEGEALWTFSRQADSLIVSNAKGDRYLLWQTDIKAANGLLHTLRPIDSQLD